MSKDLTQGCPANATSLPCLVRKALLTAALLADREDPAVLGSGASRPLPPRRVNSALERASADLDLSSAAYDWPGSPGAKRPHGPRRPTTATSPPSSSSPSASKTAQRFLCSSGAA